MIDKILYSFFGWVDSLFEKVDEVLTFKFPKSKKKKMKIDVKYLISILAFILAGLSGWILLSIVELKEFTRMMNGELLQIDKQIGRVYNYINSNMK